MGLGIKLGEQHGVHRKGRVWRREASAVMEPRDVAFHR